MSGRSCEKNFPLWLVPLVLEREGVKCGWTQLRRSWVAGGRAGHQIGSLGKASHRTAYRGMGPVPLTPGWSGEGERASPPRLARIS